MAAAAAAVASNLKRCIPLFDRLLIKKADTVTKSKGGIFIPEKAQAKVLKGTVLATGPGIRNQDGKLLPLSVNIGDVVMLAEYGGTKIELSDNQEYHLYREDDVLAVIDETREKFFPLYDRVIVKKADPVKQSKGGIVIPEKAQSKVLKGTVVYAGPGQRNQAEYADMHLMYGMANCNALEATRLYVERYPNRRAPDRKTFDCLDQLLRETGTFTPNRTHSGSLQRLRNIQQEPDILDAVAANPNISIRSLALQNHVPKSTSGSIVPLSVKVGDVVLLPEYGGQRFSLTEDEELFMYRESDILATVDDD